MLGAFLVFHILSPNFTTTISGPLTSCHSFANHCGWQKINAAWYRTASCANVDGFFLTLISPFKKPTYYLPWNFWSFKSNHPSLSIKSKFLIGLFNGETLRPRGKLRKFTKSGALGRCCSAVGMIATPIFRSPQLTLNNILGKLFR